MRYHIFAKPNDANSALSRKLIEKNVKSGAELDHDTAEEFTRLSLCEGETLELKPIVQLSDTYFDPRWSSARDTLLNGLPPVLHDSPLLRLAKIGHDVRLRNLMLEGGACTLDCEPGCVNNHPPESIRIRVRGVNNPIGEWRVRCLEKKMDSECEDLKQLIVLSADAPSTASDEQSLDRRYQLCGSNIFQPKSYATINNELFGLSEIDTKILDPKQLQLLLEPVTVRSGGGGFVGISTRPLSFSV